MVSNHADVPRKIAASDRRGAARSRAEKLATACLCSVDGGFAAARTCGSKLSRWRQQPVGSGVLSVGIGRIRQAGVDRVIEIHCRAN